MKTQLFVPNSKVQKDRAIMRETDERLAKYGRRGLVLNLAAYLLCVAIGYMQTIAPMMTVALTVGLLLITSLRGYYLFRFESLYARAPARWRNQYFLVTFLGAIWWSVIMVSFTVTLGMVGEVPILWLYTIVFFSTTAYGISPYRIFCQSYQIIALLPVAVSALWVGGLDGYMYAITMFVFLGLLNVQTKSMSINYWERLESNFSLKQKAKDLEAEKRDSEASVELNNEFLTNLGQEFRTSLNDVLGGLALLKDSNLSGNQMDLLQLTEKASLRQLDLVTNVMDFARIANHQLVLDISVFNLRQQLEAWITTLAVEAHQQKVELDYTFDDDLPQRVRGDAQRLEQIFSSMLANALKFSEHGHVMVEARFERKDGKRGELKLTVTDVGSITNSAVDNNQFDAFAHIETTKLGSGLWLAICRGLVECMDGDMGIIDDPELGHRLWLTLDLEIANNQPASINHNPRLHSRRVLVLESNPVGDKNVAEQMESWGVLVELAANTEIALQRLDAAANTEHAFDAILLSPIASNFADIKANTEGVIKFSRQLREDKAHQNLKQILLCSHHDNTLNQQQDYQENTALIRLLHRPVMRQTLHDNLATLLLGAEEINEKAGHEHDHNLGIGRTVLLVEDHRVNQMVAEGMLKKLGYNVKLAVNGREALSQFEGDDVDLILMDCQMPEMDGFEATREIRLREQDKATDERIPILAMTAHAAEGDEALCLAAGMDDYLVKPVRYDQLEARLKRWLGA